MRTVALATVVLAALVVVVGAPFALLLRRARDGWVAAVVDAGLLGLVAAPLAVSLWAWLGPAGAVLPAAAWVAALVAVVRRRGAALPMRPGRPTVSSVTAAAGWVAVLAGAGLLRLREVNFLPWTGDMGAYVNWANEFVRTGTLDSQWPPLYPAFLAISARLFGTEHTTVGMTLVGLLLVVAIARVLHQVGVGRWVVLGAGAVCATQLHAVWFSSFPVSESLVAPLLLVWVLLLHRALTGPARVLQVVASSVVLLALCLLRANGPLVLLPLLLVLVAVVAVRSWRPWATVWAGTVSGGVVAAAISYWYGISEISRYYVHMQLPEFLPRSVWRGLDSAGAFDPTLLTGALALAATLLGCGVLLLVGWLATRGARRPPSTPAGRHAPARAARYPGQTVVLLVAAAGFAAVLVRLAAEDGDVWRIIERMGVWLLVAAVIGLAAARWLPDEAARPVLLALAAVMVLYLVLQDARLGEPREHAYFLYWDRYLFSEVFPGALVLAGVALSQVLRALRGGLRRARVPEAGREVATALVATGCATAVVAWSIPQLDHADDEVFMRGAYELTEQLSEITDSQDDPVLWSTTGRSELDDYFFPNTWMALAKPLSFTFGADVLNLERRTDFAPDEIVDRDDIRIAASCEAAEAITVLEVVAGGEPLDARLAGSGLELEPLGVVSGTIQYLRQTNRPEPWSTAVLDVQAWRVAVPDDERITTPICDTVPWTTGSGGRSTQMQ